MSIEKVLLVDDDPLMLRYMEELMKRMGKEVTSLKNGQEAIARLREEAYDLVITDYKMPVKDGFAVLAAAKSLHRGCFVLLMTGFGSIESTVQAMRLGASNYLIKPIVPEVLEAAIAQCETEKKLLLENTYLRSLIESPPLIAESPVMKQLLADLPKIAQSQASVFITGESGTGKEVIAGALQKLSKRALQPFIKVNCAAIPDTLVESEFFGHEKGAFTGAAARKIGRFELADQGTLLLDEVTEIPLCLQPKLLRAIQEQEFERVGSMKAVQVNVRFLATSNRNMEKAIAAKEFREDLFYRLNVIPITLPPLRERIEDILPLAYTFLEQCCRENHKPKKILSEKAKERLTSYPWPGNVRELSNLIERTVVLDFGEEIREEHLQLQPLSSSIPLKAERSKKVKTLREMEKTLILETIASHPNKAKAAALLGITSRTLRNKLNEYQIENCASDKEALS